LQAPAPPGKRAERAAHRMQDHCLGGKYSTVNF
jgi:hypothetical protein